MFLPYVLSPEDLTASILYNFPWQDEAYLEEFLRHSDEVSWSAEFDSIACSPCKE